MNIKDTAKTILCYGDSNTWGYDPRNDTRYPRSVRWPYALQKLLGDDYEVVSEGLSGRTLAANDPTKPHRTGITHLTAILKAHDPLSLVIVMLGTNDVQTMYNLNAENIVGHLEQVLVLIQSKSLGLEKTPKILVVCPPTPIIPENGEIDPIMTRGSEIFKTLPALFKKASEVYGCGFLNAGDHISSSRADGYHLDPEAHLKLAEALSDAIHNLGI